MLTVVVRPKDPCDELARLDPERSAAGAGGASGITFSPSARIARLRLCKPAQRIRASDGRNLPVTPKAIIIPVLSGLPIHQ